MRLPNTSRGLRYVLCSEILDLLSLIAIGLLSSLCKDNQTVTSYVIPIAQIVLTFGCAILALYGLNIAKSDHEGYQMAWEISIGVFVAQVIIHVLTLCKVFSSTSSSVSDVLAFVSNALIVDSTRKLFAKAGNAKDANFARVLMILMILSACTLLFPILLVLLASASQTLAVILSVITLAVVLVTYILYIALLGKAVKKFA